MKSDTQVAEIIEYYEERAAIFEHDGGASRESAERDAARITAAKFDVSVEFVRLITQG